MRSLHLHHHQIILGGILLFALFFRLYNLANPTSYYFDEVYHGVTAKAYAANDPAGYEWWHDAPEPGTAYEWLHPPIAKLFMALGWKFLGQTAAAWRIPGALFGVGVIWLIYLLTVKIIKNKNVGLLAAFLASLDGLLLAQSRIGMNDIYVTFFILLAVLCYVMSRQSKHREGALLWCSGLCAGLAMSTKWSGVFVIGMVGTWELFLWWMRGKAWLKRLPALILIFGVLPLIVYVASYGQWWLQGHTWSQFEELHSQIIWYQTHLEATHNYQSKAWEWPLMIRPVWYWVTYGDNDTVVNLYNLANPLLGWFGLTAMIGLIFHSWCNKKTQQLTVVSVLVIAYAWSWMPWLLSPRIMFFYHYTPAIPFLCIALAWELWQWWQMKGWGRYGVIAVLCAVFVTFFWLLPMWVGIPLKEDQWKWLFWLPTWK